MAKLISKAVGRYARSNSLLLPLRLVFTVLIVLGLSHPHDEQNLRTSGNPKRSLLDSPFRFVYPQCWLQ